MDSQIGDSCNSASQWLDNSFAPILAPSGTVYQAQRGFSNAQNTCVGYRLLKASLDYAVFNGTTAEVTGTLSLPPTDDLPTLQLPLSAGCGYYLKETGQTLAGLACTGQTPVFCAPGGVMNVPLPPLTCGATGSLARGSCASFTTLAVWPSTTAVGSSVQLLAAALDGSNQTWDLATQWSQQGAGSGTFADASSPSTTFTCQAAGNVDLTVTVQLTQGPSCTASTWDVPIVCTPTVAAVPASPRWGAAALAFVLALCGVRAARWLERTSPPRPS
jgi:hypothetical protein